MINTKNPGVLEAIREIKVMSLSKRMRLRHEAHLKEIRDKKAREDFVRLEGEKIGIEKGIEKGIQKGIEKGIEHNLTELIQIKLKKGKSIEQIAEELEETVEHIEELIGKMNL